MSTHPAKLISLATIARRYPGARGAIGSHPATWTRWILKGCIGADGHRYKLAATRFGSRWLVTEAAVESFFASLTPTPIQVDIPDTETNRQDSAEAAARELEAAGA